MFRRMSSSTLSTIAKNLKQTNDRVVAAGLRRPEHLQYVEPRLVAISKTKSVEMIIDAYDAGQRHFGENYVVELVGKANDIELQDRCEEIQWHFVGHLQRNKVSKVLGIPNLSVVETIDSERLAKSVNDAWTRLKKETPLQIMVQVNTSGEENKNGVSLGSTTDLVRYIHAQCPRLKVIGLMTIGAYDYNPSAGPNPDFLALVRERDAVCKELNFDLKEVGLSMGMSSDFEQAVELGSTNVRVGSTIFGGRPKPQAQGDGGQLEKAGTDGNTTKSETDLSVKTDLSAKTDLTKQTNLTTEQIQQIALT